VGDTEPIVYAQQISVPYHYTAGDAQTAFLRGLQDGRIVGSRHGDRVLVPARPFAPDGTRTDGFVDVADEGTLQAWTTRHHEGEARTFGLIRLDGADTDLLHVIDAAEDDLSAGLRVRARWSGDRVAEVTAIEAFEPVS
jgi:uncharacterized protein